MRIAIGVLWIGLGILYYQVLSFEALTYDDPLFLSKHPAAEMSLGSFVFWQTLFFSSTANLWHPLTDLTHQVLYRVSQGPPLHHLFNVLLHGGTATLWLFFLRRLIGRVDLALAVTLVFAWHPVTVESVAWISGRKDLLCTLFLSLAVFLYHDGVQQKRSLHSLPFFAVFVAALLSKPIAFILPLLLLAIDYWPLARKEPLGVLLKEKWALWILALLSVLTTVWFQSKGTQAIEDSRTLVTRLAEALWALESSAKSILWPFELHFVYRNPAQLSLLWIGLALLFALIGLVLCYWKRKSSPFLASGFFWYLIALGPTLGLLRAGNNLAADRYSYFPLLGLLFVLAGLALASQEKKIFRSIFLFGLLAFTVICFALTFRQVSHWQSQQALFSHVLEHEPRNLIAHEELAVVALRAGKRELVKHHLDEALSIDKKSPGAHLTLGQLAFAKGNYEDAYEHYETASKVSSREAWIYERLAACAHGKGDLVATRQHLSSALQLAQLKDKNLKLAQKWRAIFPDEVVPD